jgi:Ca2+-transporting ATPase
VLLTLESSALGLSTHEAQARQKVYGPNLLPAAASESVMTLIWRQLNNPLIYVLIASALLAVALGKRIDGLVVLGVVVINTLIGFMQEYRANRTITALSALVPESVIALRDGDRRSLAVAELVPGDVALLQPGDRVPADMRLLWTKNLQVEEATLTGESLPASKSIDTVAPGASLADRNNMVYSGTLVVSGTATAVVVATAAATELGHISSLLKSTVSLETPLTRQIAEVSKLLTLVITGVAIVLLAIGLLRGYPLADAVLVAVTLAVAAIPEGLPAIITIALAIGVQRMAKRRAVIRRLPAVETLGSTTVICSDKTGTLTRNEMTVTELWTPLGRYHVSGIGYTPQGAIEHQGVKLSTIPDDVYSLLLAGALCNDAQLKLTSRHAQISGDPTEGALLVAALKGGIDLQQTHQLWPRLDTLPFESEQQYMATLHLTPHGQHVLYMKGAPEQVLRRCHRLPDGSAVDHDALMKQVSQLASAGLRVLALATATLQEPLEVLDTSTLTTGAVATGLTLLGFQAMIDPLREEALVAVHRCQKAGITVKMITGDHKETAQAIGRQLGLMTADAGAFTGAELATLSDDALQAVALNYHVFARVAPEQKLRLVRSLQAQGEVVAMTGDGVNDAPALKQADIGVAMGITGTTASKEAADMVLTDDNFASIAAAVEEGRRVYDNLIKALAFVLPTNIGEALIILLAVVFFPIIDGTPLLPMLPVQILWINLVATVALALPLAFEAMEQDVMARPPHSPRAPLLGRFVLLRTLIAALLMTLGAIGLFLYDYQMALAQGLSTTTALPQAQTITVTAVVFFQIFYLLHCRSLRGSLTALGLWSNLTLYLGIVLLLLLQAGFVYLPVMNQLFGSVPLGFVEWCRAALVGIIILPVISLEKAWRRRTDTAIEPQVHTSTVG